MEELFDKIKKEFVKEDNKQRGIIVEKYYVEIYKYPDGKTWCKMIPCGSYNKESKLKKPKLPIEQTKITESEVY